MAHILTKSKKQEGQPRPEWLTLIHEANRIEPEFFGEPLLFPFSNGAVELYEHAFVTHYRAEGETLIMSSNDHGHDVLEQAIALIKR